MLERTVLRLLHEQEDEMAGNLALQWTTNDHSYNKLCIHVQRGVAKKVLLQKLRGNTICNMIKITSFY